MQPMTPDEVRAFLSHGTRTGKLATVRADGRPHVAPIWFILDGDTLVFNTHVDTVKAKNLARTRYAALTVDDQAPPYAYVMVEGPVEIFTDYDRDLWVHWATHIGGRYMGADRAEEYGLRNGVVGEWLIRLIPTKTVAQKDLAA